MAKINKLQKSGQTIYPLTIPEAVIDSVTGKTQKQVNTEFKAIQDGQLKLKNEVVNGDFRDGISNWDKVGGTISYTGGGLEYTITNLNWTSRVATFQDFAYQADSKYYIKTSISSSKTGLVVVALRNVTLADFTGNIKIGTHNGSGLQVFSAITTSDQTYSSRLGLGIRQDYLLMNDIYKINSVVIIDITNAFGKGNEPTKNEMDELIKILPNGYFEGDLQNKYLHIWQLKLIRQNRNAIVALGGTII